MELLKILFTSTISIALVNLIIELIKIKKPGRQVKAIQSILRDRITSISLIAISDGHISAIDYQNLMYLYESYKNYKGNSYVDNLIIHVNSEVKIGEN